MLPLSVSKIFFIMPTNSLKRFLRPKTADFIVRDTLLDLPHTPFHTVVIIDSLYRQTESGSISCRFLSVSCRNSLSL